MLKLSRGMDRVLTTIFLEENRPPAMWRPPTDVYETEDRVVIKVEIPGMNPDEIEISFEDRILRISGTRLDQIAKRSYHCLEIQYGDFVSEVYLPGMYDQDMIEAEYQSGFLTIRLPKLNHEPRNIEIHANSK
jgi:HSP20 family protein